MNFTNIEYNNDDCSIFDSVKINQPEEVSYCPRNYFQIENYFSELDHDEAKRMARENLDITWENLLGDSPDLSGGIIQFVTWENLTGNPKRNRDLINTINDQIEPLKQQITNVDNLLQSEVVKNAEQQNLVNERLDAIDKKLASGGGSSGGSSDEVNEKLETIDTQINSITNQIININDRVNSANNQITAIKSQVNITTSQVNNLINQTDSFNERLDNVDDQVITFDQRLNAINGQINILNSQIEDINEKLKQPITGNTVLYSSYGDNEDGAVTQEFFTKKVQKLEDSLFPFKFSYLNGGGTFEIGSVQTINLSWEYDRDIDNQYLNNSELSKEDRTAAIEDVTENTTYTIKAVSGQKTISKSVSAQFKLKRYYGVSEKESLTNDDILSLTNNWAQRQLSTTIFDCTGGKYVYYIIPSNMITDIEFWINGLRNTDWLIYEENITNTYNHVDSYTIYRLSNKQNGILKIEVR